MGESVGRQGDHHLPTADSDSLETWIKSVGDVAAPLLAGFSFTSVIVVSGSVEHFRWSGAAILALTIAAIMLIAAVQCAKYALDERPSKPPPTEASARPVIFFRYLLRTGGWRGWTRRFYHLGLIALLAGLAFALVPPRDTGGQDILRWVASILAFVACVLETLWFMTAGRARRAEDDQASKLPRSLHG